MVFYTSFVRIMRRTKQAFSNYAGATAQQIPAREIITYEKLSGRKNRRRFSERQQSSPADGKNGEPVVMMIQRSDRGTPMKWKTLVSGLW